MADLTMIQWTFFAECEVPEELTAMLMEDEVALVAYKTIRDAAVFTNKRLIVSDAQGLSGKKVEIYSLPWSVVDMWSSENAGTLDFNSEIELWTKAGHIKVNLKKGADVRKIDRMIARCVLGSKHANPY